MKLTTLHLFRLTFGLLLLCSFLQPAHAQKGRVDYNMNTQWAFYRGDIANGKDMRVNDSEWMPVVLPHIMQLEKKHCGGDIIYNGVGWYRRYFKLPVSLKNKRISVHFEGVMNACELFVNGKLAATNHGGYVGFTTDITDKVFFGNENNVIALRVSAEYDPLTPPGKPQDRMDFYYYSGIYRDATLTVTDKLFITDELEENEIAGGGIFVTYPHVSKQQAQVHVRTHVGNNEKKIRQGRIVHRLLNDNGKTVANKSVDFTIKGDERLHVECNLDVNKPQLWHPYTPHLYTLITEITDGKQVIDSRKDVIGIRHIRFSRDSGFFINNEPLYLVGANRHQSFPYVGDATSNSMQERDVIDMKRGGYNAVRAAHYPQDPAFLAACDKHGLLVIECIPGWQYYNNNPIFADRMEQIGQRMIRRDRNRPSVVLWETALNEIRYPVEVVERIFNAAHEEYPGNQFYTAGDYFGHKETAPFYDVFYKQVGEFPKDGNVMSNYLEDQVSIKPLLTREWGDGVGRKPRVSMAENEYEQLLQCQTRLAHLNGNGYFDWCMLDANPRMGGHFMWSYNDYARGAEDETMYSGVVDVNRFPKFGYYMMQSMRPAQISQKNLYAGPMVFIASHNADAAYPSASNEITVFSNCDEVRLYRNQKHIGTQSRGEARELYPHTVQKGGSPAFIFDAKAFEAGTLYAEGWSNGKRVAKHEVKTPEKAAKIEVYVPEHGIRPQADGSDMVPVYFKICDKNGTRIPNDNTEITISVKGEGKLVGDSIQRVGINPQRVEGGIGFAFVRTTGTHGRVEVSASANGLESGKAVFSTYPAIAYFLPDGDHGVFGGHTEDNIVVRAGKSDKQLLAQAPIAIQEITASSQHAQYPVTNLTDGNDFSWWIAAENSFPQVVTVALDKVKKVKGSRIRFQKDSSSYKHKVETSTDGITWHTLYERECTGWEFAPMEVNRDMKYLRITILATTGNAGMAQVTLF
ncbi:MAG: glycoside hydrolase family 2 TIM barrel-domain containing protein [Marinifilaceae bacterium]